LTANAQFTPINGVCKSGSIATHVVLYAEAMRGFIKIKFLT